MPYIEQSRRVDLRCGAVPQDAGELNYAITKLVLLYMGSAPVKYQRINDVVGALEGAKLEFYRRYVAAYEDVKIEANGDVY